MFAKTCMVLVITMSLFSSPSANAADQLPPQAEAYFRARDAQYAELSGEKPPFQKFAPELDPKALRVGAVGVFPSSTSGYHYACIQVIDKKTCVVGPYQLLYPRTLSDGTGTFVIYTPEPMTGTPKKSAGQDFWLEGVSTEGIVDDALLRLPGVYEVAGTKTYMTVVGASRTIYLVKPFNIDPYLPGPPPTDPAPSKSEFRPPSREEANAEKRRLIESKLWREWTDSTGKFTVKAKFLALEPEAMLALEKEDGTKILIKMYKLRLSDQSWIRNDGLKMVEELKKFDADHAKPE